MYIYIYIEINLLDSLGNKKRREMNAYWPLVIWLFSAAFLAKGKNWGRKKTVPKKREHFILLFFQPSENPISSKIFPVPISLSRSCLYGGSESSPVSITAWNGVDNGSIQPLHKPWTITLCQLSFKGSSVSASNSTRKPELQLRIIFCKAFF